MTDADAGVPEWGPQIGWLDLSDERRELIKGLYQLAAWVAEHRELPLPAVDAHVFAGIGAWDDTCAVVDRIAAALGAEAEDRGTDYRVQSRLGPVKVWSASLRPERHAALDALYSYDGFVTPDADPAQHDAGVDNRAVAERLGHRSDATAGGAR